MSIHMLYMDTATCRGHHGVTRRMAHIAIWVSSQNLVVQKVQMLKALTVMKMIRPQAQSKTSRDSAIVKKILL